MMKRMLKILALMMACILLCTALFSCRQRLSAEYENALYDISFAFEGRRVTYTRRFLGKEQATAKGRYVIKGDKITLTFDEENEETKAWNGTFDFEQGENYIKIGKFGKFTVRES